MHKHGIFEINNIDLFNNKMTNIKYNKISVFNCSVLLLTFNLFTKIEK